jgi:hypothetical protein
MGDTRAHKPTKLMRAGIIIREHVDHAHAHAVTGQKSIAFEGGERKADGLIIFAELPADA